MEALNLLSPWVGPANFSWSSVGFPPQGTHAECSWLVTGSVQPTSLLWTCLAHWASVCLSVTLAGIGWKTRVKNTLESQAGSRVLRWSFSRCSRRLLLLFAPLTSDPRWPSEWKKKMGGKPIGGRADDQDRFRAFCLTIEF